MFRSAGRMIFLLQQKMSLEMWPSEHFTKFMRNFTTPLAEKNGENIHSALLQDGLFLKAVAHQSLKDWRKVRGGNKMRGNRSESLREENPPLGGPLRGSLGDLIFITSEPLRRFGDPLGDPLGGRFSSRRLSDLFPLIGFSLKLS